MLTRSSDESPPGVSRSGKATSCAGNSGRFCGDALNRSHGDGPSPLLSDKDGFAIQDHRFFTTSTLVLGCWLLDVKNSLGTGRPHSDLLRGSALFLCVQGLLVTRQRLGKTLQPIIQSAFVQVGNGHRIVDRNGAIVAIQGFLAFTKPFESGPLLDPVSYTHLTLPTKRIV